MSAVTNLVQRTIGMINKYKSIILPAVLTLVLGACAKANNYSIPPAASNVKAYTAESSSINPNSVVKFTDTLVETRVRESLIKPTQPLLQKDVETITKLNLQSKKSGDFIKSLEGIENLSNLDSLNSIADLASLTNLTELSLSNNHITDLTPYLN